MRITFFRHGIAEDRGGKPDAERALTEEGVKKTRRAAKGLAKVADQPDAILTSPKTRAVQTADLVAEAFGAKHATLDALGSADTDAILHALGERGESELLLVGHEPDFSELVERLCFGRAHERVDLKKAGCAIVDCPEGVRDGGGELSALLPPKVLRSL